MLRYTFLLLFMGLMSAFSTCESTRETIEPADTTKLSGEWKLVEPASAYRVTLVLEVDPTAQTIAGVAPFNVTGKSSVNHYFANLSAGTVTQDGGPRTTVSVGSIAATKMAGPPEAMEFESTYFSQLKAVSRFELTSQNRLRLFYDGPKPGVLVYERVK